MNLDAGTTRCNSSICSKIRYRGVRADPGSFRMLRGEGALGSYAFSEGRPEHCFRNRCGVPLFGRGHIAELGGDFVSVSVVTIDDASIGELVAAPVMWCDGLNDNGWNSPGEIRHL